MHQYQPRKITVMWQYHYSEFYFFWIQYQEDQLANMLEDMHKNMEP